MRNSQNYIIKIMQVISIILLLALACLSASALIGSTIYSLSRLFQYRISITAQEKTMVQYATLAPVNVACPAGKCFIGWIGNYTLGGEVVEGFRQGLGTNNPLFFSQLLQTPSLTVVSSKFLETTAKTLLGITAKVLTPLPFLASNARPENSDQIFNFVPLDGKSDEAMTASSLDPLAYSFKETSESFQTGESWVGWNNANPASDVVLYDRGLNCLLKREIVFADGARMHIQMVSKSLFVDLTEQLQIIAEIKADEGIKEELTFTAASAFPAESLALLLQLI